jgi:microcystin degradation protein MlrC
MKDVFDRCREWEKKPGVYCVSVAPGYAYADVVDIGMSVFAVTDNDQQLAETVAQDLSDFAWSLRESFAAPLPGTEESVRLAMEAVAAGKGPVVLADGADRIGDSTHLLKELIKSGAENWAVPCIADPKACVELEKNHKAGEVVTVTAGGWYDEFSGAPATVTGKIVYMGRPSYVLTGPMEKGRKVQDKFCCHLDLGGNRHVVISQEARWVLDGSSFAAVGIDYTKLDIIGLKDRVHHRAFWDTVTKTNIRTSIPGQGPADLRTLRYENLPDHVFPIGKKWR